MFSINNFKILYKNSNNILNILSNNNSNKNLILEPITCLVRISVLHFKNKGTKIGISNNGVYIQEPGIIQGALRWTSGDNRNDLHNLHNPILKATEWYSTSNKEINEIFNFAKLGLEKLKLAYNENSIISHTIDLYISILNNSLKQKNIKKKVKGEEKVITNVNDNIDDNKIVENINDVRNNFIYKSFKDLWTNREIKIVHNILVEIQEKKKENKDINISNYIKCLDNILIEKEKMVANIVKKVSTIL